MCIFLYVCAHVWCMCICWGVCVCSCWDIGVHMCVYTLVFAFLCVCSRAQACLKGAPFVAEHTTDTNSPCVDQLMLNKNQQEL